MNIQNVTYPEKEYRQFGKMLIDANPKLDDMLEDQQVVDMYNQIKDQLPTITMEQLGQMIPRMVNDIFSKLKQAPTEGREDKLAALNAMRG